MATKSTARSADGRPDLGEASTTADGPRAASEPGTLVLVCVTAWAIPGAGHLWLGRRQKAAVFFVALLAMFVSGLLLKGRLFPFEFSEPLVALAAFANAGMGLPWIAGADDGRGQGSRHRDQLRSHGNCFLIVAGLLNFLVVLDAFDIAVGRK